MSEAVDRRADVLVVEDEIVIGMFLQEELQDAGYRVVVASSAREGRQQVRSHTSGFSAAVIDLGLPDERGDALAIELAARQPEIAIVIASAMQVDVCSDRRLRAERCRIVAKPYNSSEVVSALEQCGVLGCTTRRILIGPTPPA